jgi:hypothetical protein
MDTVLAVVHACARGLTAAGIVVALGAFSGGCANLDLDETSPSAMVRPPEAVPTGLWRGTISSREMVDAAGQMSASVELTVNSDGTFVLTDSNGGRATGHARFVGETLVLDGTFVSPASRAGERVSERLRRGRNDALYGTIDTVFRGLKVTGLAGLQRVM